MSEFAVPRRRVLVLIPVLLVALFSWWATRSGSEAAPPAGSGRASTAQAGKIAFDSFPGGVKATLPLRSFTAGGANDSSSAGGSGTGKFVPADTTAAIDAATVDPLMLQAVTTGVHLSKVTVTLFRPGTTDRQETWALTNATLSALHTTQSGSAKAPRVSLGLRYATVTVTTYDTTGAVARSYCFDLAANAAC